VRAIGLAFEGAKPRDRSYASHTTQSELRGGRGCFR